MRPALYVLVGLLMHGCGTTPYGSFLSDGTEELQRAIGTDAGRQLQVLYPPSSHWVVFGHASDDAFGRALERQLARSGYAIRQSPDRGSKGLRVRYVVDGLDGTRWVRAIVYVGSRRLSRIYAMVEGTGKALGPWAFDARDE